MKAESTIFRHIQKPMTMVGVSPMHLFLIVIGGFALLVVFIAIGEAEIGAATSIFAVCIAWYRTFRITQDDHHFASKHFVAPRYWKSKKQRSQIAGHPTAKRQKGRTK